MSSFTWDKYDIKELMFAWLKNWIQRSLCLKRQGYHMATWKIKNSSKCHSLICENYTEMLYLPDILFFHTMSVVSAVTLEDYKGEEGMDLKRYHLLLEKTINIFLIV